MTEAPAEIVIRTARPGDRDALLRFIERIGFNARDAATWDGLNMTAMTAWRGNDLVGAVPLEPRPFQVRPGVVVTTLHQTVVGVHPHLRSSGIGSRMQEALAHERFGDEQLMTVFREEPASAAYRWYVKNEFRPALHIDSWFLDMPAESGSAPELRAANHPAVDHAELTRLWCEVWGERFGGFVHRGQRPLGPWLAIHPYRTRYKFGVITCPGGYALLGVGRLHSETERVDILELTATEPAAGDRLLRAIEAHARERGWHPIRWPIASTDVHATEAATRRGFERRWGFDLLMRPVAGASVVTPNDLPAWRYLSVDFI